MQKMRIRQHYWVVSRSVRLDFVGNIFEPTMNRQVVTQRDILWNTLLKPEETPIIRLWKELKTFFD